MEEAWMKMVKMDDEESSSPSSSYLVYPAHKTMSRVWGGKDDNHSYP